MPEPRDIRDAEIVREPGRVVDAEVVRDAGTHGRSERVTASRIPGGVFISREYFQFGGDPTAARKRLRDLQVKLWLWLLGFAVIAAGCFYGAFVTEVVIWAALLLIGGALCLLGASVTWLIIWAVRRIPKP
jgi:hypothetical protein